MTVTDIFLSSRMKHIILSAILFAAMKRSSNTCGDPTDALPFYRVYNPSIVTYRWSTSTVVASSPGVTFEGVAALVFVTQEESTVPFYRLSNAATTDNFYTISTTERDSALQNGYIFGGAGTDSVYYIYPTQICGSVPFYRLYQESTKTNFYTISESERLDYIANHGYTDIEIAGYVLPLASNQCS
ncbi:hypothetical protein B0H13DRAFT_1889350 [Mycena leptocephala]|nr:hypothetical protein B0H13DRAFT_1889350 [Mycena leptocephala]